MPTTPEGKLLDNDGQPHFCQDSGKLSCAVRVMQSKLVHYAKQMKTEIDALAVMEACLYCEEDPTKTAFELKMRKYEGKGDYSVCRCHAKLRGAAYAAQQKLEEAAIQMQDAIDVLSRYPVCLYGDDAE